MAETETRVTTKHDEIRRWAEKCGGVPATVSGTEKGGEEAGVLRFKFRESSDERLREISWDEFFDRFEKEKLVLLYQEGDEETCDSRFFKLVDRGHVH